MVPALVVGALTAWYLGLRLGVIITVVVAVAMLVAQFVPGMSLAVYALVIAWAALLYFFGPKVAKATGKQTIFGKVGSGVGQASAWVRKMMGGDNN